MTTLDQVKKYRAIVSSMPDFVLIIFGSIVTSLSLYIFMRLSRVFIGYNYLLNNIGSIEFLLIFAVGIYTGTYWVRRKVKSVKLGQWKDTLSEGAPGVIKLLQELQWNNIFSDIRSAKLGFFLYGISKILAYWSLAFISMIFFRELVRFVLHISIGEVTILIFSLIVILILSRNDLGKRYEQMGRLDWLLWELRWFESEFRGANFKT